MKKKILFLCDGFGQNNDATGICVRNVAFEFQRKDYEVLCVFNSGKNDEYFVENGIQFFGIKSALFDRIKQLSFSKNPLSKLFFKFFSLLRHIVLVPFYPNVSVVRSRRYLKKTLDIVKKENVSLIVGSYRPYEAIYALEKAKNRLKDHVFCVAYHLDLLTAPNTVNDRIKSFQKKKAWKSVVREQRIVDLMVLPGAIENEKYRLKNIRFADFPVCVPNPPCESFELPYKDDYFNLAYVGTLNKQNRNPQYFIEMLDLIGSISEKKIVWHIWGNIEPSLKQMMLESKHVVYHGLLDNSKVLYALTNADTIVNISNEQTLNMVPSKIFQYFSTQKPILNIVSSVNDAALPYFAKYGKSLNVFKVDCKEKNAVAVQQFLSNGENLKKNIDVNFLKKSTPSYFVELLENAMLEKGFA